MNRAKQELLKLYAFLLLFAKDRRAMGLTTREMIETVVIFMVWLAVTPVIVEQTQTMLKNATAASTKWNFTGASGAKILLGLAPFIWVAVGLLGIFLSLLVYAKDRSRI